MLIDSENLIARLDKCYHESAKTGLGLEPVMAIQDIKALISVMPEVDAAPVKHGKWIPNEIHGHKIKVINGIPNGSCICDVCGQWLVGSNEYDVYGNYCPACGAKMDLEEQECTSTDTEH